MSATRNKPLDVALATCAELPRLTPDDQLLLPALERRGLRAVPAVWDDPAFDWAAVRLVVIRSTWDYTTRRAEYLAWAERVAAVTLLRNPLPIVRWNTHKAYLEDFARRGLPVVPTACFGVGARVDLAALMAERNWRDVVIKPAVSATARETIRLADIGFDAAQAHLDRLLPREDMLVQPFLARIESEGELSVLFISDSYSHAIRKRPVPGDYRAQDEFGGSMELVTPAPDETQLASSVLATVGAPMLYARIDLMRDDAGALCLSELELVEPMLYFRQHPPAADRLAAAIARLLQS